MSGNEECRRAAEKAMNLLLCQDRTRKELADRLYRAGFSEEASDYAMAYVESFGYIDDFRYASNYLACHKGERSGKELRYKLLGRGIPREILSEVFQEYEAEDEERALERQLAKRLRGRCVSELETAEKNKVTAYLVRKGYPAAKVKRVMQQQEE